MTIDEMISVLYAYRDGAEIEWKTSEGWVDIPEPELFCQQEYRVKPQPKKIDMSVCIESGVDCEFFNCSKINAKIDYLKHLEELEDWEEIRVRQDHWIYNEWDKCPIPEGLEIIIKLQNGDTDTTTQYMSAYYWDKTILGIQTIAFKVIGAAEGYTYD